ncbi:heme-binding protein [Aureimonas leprariae]|uniref:heme-binding protein n=1 Tax=Plantimonas leprariae TaxID=2615207 RepID=UPI001FE2884A|nr:heme-binding protein [Aureimonas leprariae]
MNTQSTDVAATATVSRTASDALLKAAFEAAAGLGFEAAVAVVDAGGALKGFTRSDGAVFLPPTRDQQGVDGRVLRLPDPRLERLCRRPKGRAARQFAAHDAGRRRLPAPAQGRLVGGISISGGIYQQDQDAAVAAL